MKDEIKITISYLLDAVKGFFIRVFSSRIVLLAIVFAVLFSVIGIRLFNLQIVNSEYYAQNFTTMTQRTVAIAAARGNIYDCNGNVLAYNKLTYSVTLTDEIPSSSTRAVTLNEIIIKAVRLIEANGDSIIDDFNIELKDGSFEFKENPQTAQITFLINIFGGTSDELYENGYDKYSAEELMEYLCEFFGIAESYSDEEKLKIATIRYTLYLTSYQKYVAVTIADDICEETKAAVLESTETLTGIDVEEKYERVYNYSIYFAQIIGYTGEISEDELEEYNTENATNHEYEQGDSVGKSGIEKTYDAYLQGTKGSQTLYVDSTGNILEVSNRESASSGNDVYLTIDRDLQIVAYNALEKELAACLLEKIVDYDYKSTGDTSEQTYIAVKDVYAQILTNILDFESFSDEDATEREKEALNAYEPKKAEIIAEIDNQLNSETPAALNELSDEMYEYMSYVYDMLTDNNIIDANSVDTDDSVYQDWSNGNISLREFLLYAVSQNWIALDNLSGLSGLASADEIYGALISQTLALLETDRYFAEKVYYYLVWNSAISPYSIIMMLYDQEILEWDSAADALTSGEISTYEYVREQIGSLKLTPAMIALDPCTGSLCVTDSDTGQVKALVTYPSYDNNKLSGSIDYDYWVKINYDDSQPLYNVATRALTAPGSTFKLCTSVAALSEGYITTETQIYDRVTFDLISPSPKCWVSPSSHGLVNLSQALEGSCNYFFFEIGYNMGITDSGTYSSSKGLDIISDYAAQLGLGDLSGVEIEETSPRISTTDSVRSAIGQGTNGFTCVQMARYVNTVANSGVNYKLSLLSSIKASSGEILVENESTVTNTVALSDEDWSAIHYGMYLVTSSDGGTAHTFFTDLQTSVAGKTGTAQENKFRANHAAFVGYAPYENPEISFACMIRNCDSTSYPGGTMSIVLRYYFGEISFDDVMALPVSGTGGGYVTE